jgi:hypothetical protein
MTHDRSRTGVCFVRIETQGSRMLLTLRMIPDIERVSTERVRVVMDVEAAVREVREFLETFRAAQTG